MLQATGGRERVIAFLHPIVAQGPDPDLGRVC